MPIRPFFVSIKTLDMAEHAKCLNTLPRNDGKGVHSTSLKRHWRELARARAKSAECKQEDIERRREAEEGELVGTAVGTWDPVLWHVHTSFPEGRVLFSQDGPDISGVLDCVFWFVFDLRVRHQGTNDHPTPP